ncbi:hypothetical protein L596_023926 [Steinernema carpocapsae]|uniref:Uncharacterized protein n=1 Tax=Steinernema carpocapsae TaxID=34508 RepID=A0A4U5MF43_STECR|nr:hypothetical protein L596_023926 [Steinernema carpocapsae]
MDTCASLLRLSDSKEARERIVKSASSTLLFTSPRSSAIHSSSPARGRYSCCHGWRHCGDCRWNAASSSSAAESASFPLFSNGRLLLDRRVFGRFFHPEKATRERSAAAKGGPIAVGFRAVIGSL